MMTGGTPMTMETPIWVADKITCLLRVPAMDMAKVGGTLSVVKVFAQIWHPKSTPYYTWVSR